MAYREPAEIEREIELTRVYLSDTVDAIAERVNPKIAANRTAHAVVEKLKELTTTGTETFTARTAGIDQRYEVRRRLRLDRVGIVVGAAVGVAGLVTARVLRRR